MNAIPVRVVVFTPEDDPGRTVEYYTKETVDRSGVFNIWSDDLTDTTWKVTMYGRMSPVDAPYRLRVITNATLGASGSFALRLVKYPIMRFVLDHQTSNASLTINFLE